MGERWMIWTLLEAGTRTISRVLQKFIGTASTAFGHLFFATLIIGLVQTIVGFIAIKTQKKNIVVDAKNLIGSVAFGFLAVISSILSFATFYYGGEIGVSTFIITLSIIPGVLIDRYCFKKKLDALQKLGVIIALLAGYSILGFPSFEEALKLPIWIRIAAVNACTVAINQGITQKIQDVDVMVKNFWGGLTTFLMCAIALLVSISFNSGSFVQYLSMHKLIYFSLIVGVVVVGMWSFNLLSYKGGASITFKKIIMNGSYFIFAMITGIIFFGETFTVSKALGIILYVLAFVLIDKKTRKFFNFVSTV